MPNKRQIPKEVYKAAVIAVRKTVYNAFNRTRGIVPVRTGKLKSSGSNEVLENGSVTMFKVPYACIYPKKTIDNYIVQSNKKRRRFSSLRPGLLLSNGKGEDREIIAIEKRKVLDADLYLVETESGKRIILTGNHIVPTKNKGEIKASDLSIDDIVYTENSSKMIPTKIILCENCGREIPVKLFSTRRFCSGSCRSSIMGKGRKAWNKNLTKDNDERILQYGKSMSEKWSDNEFKKKMSKKLKENHWSKSRDHSFNYLGAAKIDCYECHKSFEIDISNIKNGKRHFCSKDCELDWRRKKYSGKGNPHYGIQYQTRYPKGGFREDLGHYVRSRWEANVARIFISAGIRYAYEPIRFYAEECSYCPDFWLIDENIYIEVAGAPFGHEKDYSKIAKVIECNPQLQKQLFVIDGDGYQKLEKQFSKEITNWERKK